MSEAPCWRVQEYFVVHVTLTSNQTRAAQPARAVPQNVYLLTCCDMSNHVKYLYSICAVQYISANSATLIDFDFQFFK